MIVATYLTDPTRAEMLPFPNVHDALQEARMLLGTDQCTPGEILQVVTKDADDYENVVAELRLDHEGPSWHERHDDDWIWRPSIDRAFIEQDRLEQELKEQQRRRRLWTIEHEGRQVSAYRSRKELMQAAPTIAQYVDPVPDFPVTRLNIRYDGILDDIISVDRPDHKKEG